MRVCLPVQGTQVRALVWEDPTCHVAQPKDKKKKKKKTVSWVIILRLARIKCIPENIQNKRIPRDLT